MQKLRHFHINKVDMLRLKNLLSLLADCKSPNPAKLLSKLLLLLSLSNWALAFAQSPTLVRVVADNNYPPFLYIDEQGQAIGYIADWWELWSNKTGIKVDLQTPSWAESQRRLLAGEADVIDLIFRTQQREPKYDFTPPHTRVPVSIYEHHTLSGIKTVDSLRGFLIGIMSGDACIDTLRLEDIQNFKEYPSYADVITGAIKQDVKLFCMDDYPANFYLYRQNAQQQFRKTISLSDGEFHRAVKKGNKNMLALIAQGATLITEQEDRHLREKWITPLTPKKAFDWTIVWVVLGATGILLSLGLFWIGSLKALVNTRTKSLKETQYALTKRAREQACIYAVFKATESLDNNLSEVLEGITKLLPTGFHESGRHVSQVQIDGQTYEAGTWTQAKQKIKAPVLVEGVPRGEIGVGCIGPSSDSESLSFTHEEQTMLNTIAERVAETLQRRELASVSKRREKIYHAIVDQANDSMGVVDAIDGRFIEFNDSACRNLGYTREEFEHLCVQDIDAAMNPMEIKQAFEELAQSGGAVIESVHRTRSGEMRNVRISNRYLILEGRAVLVSIWSDITDTKREQSELLAYRDQLAELVAERTAELQAILDGASVGIFRMVGRTVLRCNRTLEDILGYSPQEIIGQTTRVWYPDEATFVEVGQDIQNQIAARGYFVSEQQLRRKDGQLIWTKIAARPIESGNLEKGLAAMVEDISNERLAIDQIRKARDLAEQAVRIKSDFLANMSHEIRTPMNAIIGMSHLVLNTNLDDRQRGYLEKVQRSSKHLLGIINDILDFSKLEAGKLKPEEVPFRLDELIDNVVSMLGTRADEKSLELIVDASAELPLSLIGDPLRLNQVILNLMNNAIKFTEAGEVVLGITEVTRRNGRVELMFAVRDSGIGMTHEQTEHLFTPFTQGDASTTRKFGGTGLGLAISKSLVEMMEGHFEVETVTGVGSTFRFTSWFALQNESSLPAHRMLTAKEIKGVRTLVVDDNETARIVLTEMSRSFGLQTSSAENGTEALSLLQDAAAQDRPFQLLLTDWHMPAMDGVELIDRAKRLAVCPDVAVVMVTAYAREDALQRAMNLGVEVPWVISKPVTASSLLEAIGTALDHSAILNTSIREASSPGNFTNRRLKGKRVLLVEDNDLNQELATELLRDVGIQVVLANHGQEAIDILSLDNNFDAILMDCQMPVMDGYEATRRIRSELALNDLPIIAMTANAMTGDREKVIAAGMDDYITKPLDIQHMYEVLGQWLDTTPEKEVVTITSEAREQQSKPDSMRNPKGTLAATTRGSERSQTDEFEKLLSKPLQGIDIAAGLRATNGNVSLYRRLLRRLCESRSRFADEFDVAEQRSDRVALIHIAHTLKGTAGNVGAHGLKDAAAKLEAMLKASEKQTDDPQQLEDSVHLALADILHELHLVCDGLMHQGIFNEEIGVAAKQHDNLEDNQLAFIRLEELKNLLSQGNVEGKEYWHQHSETFSRLLPKTYNRIQAALDAFDFEEALSELENLK